MRQSLLALIILMLLFGCAKQTAPTGGPKDETPPKLESATPPDQSINFNSKEIVLEFDEQIQLNNPREQFLITPSINRKYDIIAKKKKVIITLTEPLQENTTYSFNFRESVQDLNERNPAANLKLAYSTGSYIDSLYIKGTVKDLLKDQPLKNQTVALVEQSDTTNIFKYPAQWLTMSNEQGEYFLENLKPGNYTLYAFNDKNKNLIVDSKSEAFAFADSTISLRTSIENIALSTVRLDVRPLQLISTRPLGTYFNIKINKGLIDYKITDTTGAQVISNIADAGTTIKVYNTFTDLDSVKLVFNARDSIDNVIDTTFYARFNEPQQRLKEKASATINLATYETSSSTFKAKVSFNKPLSVIQTDSIYIQLDTVRRHHFTQDDIEIAEDRMTATIQSVIKKEILIPEPPEPQANQRQSSDQISANALRGGAPKTQPLKSSIVFAPTSFISIEQDTLTRLEQPVKIIRQEDTAILHIEVDTQEDFIVELLDTKFNVIKEAHNQVKINFENLPPATYLIRLIIDKNKNGKWDPGNYFTRIPPEPVVYYTTEKGETKINLKAFWEVGPLLITY